MNPLGIRTVLLFVLALPLLGLAQRHTVVMHPDTAVPAKWLRPVQAANAERVQAIVGERIAFPHGKGFLEATCDTCYTSGDSSLCPFVVGRSYKWAQLTTRGVPAEIASEAGFRERLYADAPIDPRQVGRLFQALLRRSENNGHPFAKVWLDSIVPQQDGLRAVLRMEQGRLVKFDSVVVRGSARTNLRFLYASIGIRPGDMYNEALLQSVEKRIRELPFVTQRQRPYVQFTPEMSKLFLFLDAKKASSINGILGLQPDPLTGKVNLTGDLDLRLRNALKRGEAIELNWRRLQNGTQDLKIHGNLPYALNTPFGVDGMLKLFKRDTTFLELTARAGLEYLMSQGDKVTLFVNSKSSDRLGSNTIAQPGLADVSLISYGLGLFRERFDYRFNPRRGHALQLEGSAGRKRTSQAVFGQLEVAPEIRTVQLEVNGTATAHIPLARRSTIRLSAQGGTMVNDDLYVNELYRIGGLKTLRGADEASIQASSYVIGTLEVRIHQFVLNGHVLLRTILEPIDRILGSHACPWHFPERSRHVASFEWHVRGRPPEARPR
ncbi:MAG: hypothetical protein IPJ10_17075 [Flavobacteriales bacterium]|nr:hypothetical protein [Flavobacteriales bacterium]